jgi:hypothetical protein
MKQSDLNHLRRLVAWVRCEIGQAPHEMVATVRTVADKLGHPEISPEAQQRLVHAHDKARQVPKYVRAAVMALEKAVGTTGPVVDAEAQPTEGWRPAFDVMSPRQEELVIQFCQEIAGRRGEPGCLPDPVRLLEMAEALYEAERNDFAPKSQEAA